MLFARRGAGRKFVTKESTNKVLFWCAIAAQVAGAQIIIWDGRPLYQQLMTGATNVGSPKDYALDFMAIAVMQVGYWFAYRLQPRLRFRRNAVVGHLLCCIGEVSFLFIAALGTVVLLDHWREWQFVSWKAGMLVGMIFAFYCYERQLVGLGERMLKSVDNEVVQPTRSS